MIAIFPDCQAHTREVPRLVPEAGAYLFQGLPGDMLVLKKAAFM
jgi:hypothetical protein